MPASEVARRIGDISERAVRYRIDRMVEEGIISVSAVAKPQAFGLTTIADVWLEVESDRIIEVARKLAGVLFALWRDASVYEPERKLPERTIQILPRRLSRSF